MHRRKCLRCKNHLVTYSPNGKAHYSVEVMGCYLPWQIVPFYEEPANSSLKDVWNWGNEAWRQRNDFHSWRRDEMMWYTDAEKVTMNGPGPEGELRKYADCRKHHATLEYFAFLRELAKTPKRKRRRTEKKIAKKHKKFGWGSSSEELSSFGRFAHPALSDAKRSDASSSWSESFGRFCSVRVRADSEATPVEDSSSDVDGENQSPSGQMLSAEEHECECDDLGRFFRGDIATGIDVL